MARVVALALGATALVPVLGIPSAFAATGEQYLLQATDPHGNIWLPGTTNGLTSGPMDPGTDPASASYGHLWTTDVPSGFCRIIPAVPATDTVAGTAAFLDRSTPGGCITAGGKAGGPDLDPRRNADGTFYLYTPDWAVKSAGVYRLTYDPGQQVMIKSELLAPNRYPGDNKPFDAQLGKLDHKLYVSSDLDGNINRIAGVNGVISQQTVEAGIAKSSDGSRMRAITFACWSALNGKRSAGAPGCSSADPTPDLVMAQKNSITVVLNAETCQAAVGGCTTLLTPIKVLTPMGLRTDPKNPDVVYVSDSPGTVSQIIRYTISSNIQDSYANFGILDAAAPRSCPSPSTSASGPTTRCTSVTHCRVNGIQRPLLPGRPERTGRRARSARRRRDIAHAALVADRQPVRRRRDPARRRRLAGHPPVDPGLRQGAVPDGPDPRRSRSAGARWHGREPGDLQVRC